MAAILYENNSAFSTRVITVSDTEELTSAIRTLSWGEGGTILVDGGADPYILNAQNLGREGAPVLIKPLDDDIPPHIEQINILNASHLTITGMDIDSERVAKTRPTWESDVNVRLSNDINIVGNSLDSTADGYRDGITSVGIGARGAMLRDSENINFSHNTVANYRDGIIYLEVKGLTLVGNEITGIQGDGMRGGGIQDVLIAGNYMHDFYGSVQTLNHSDMIQIWGTSVDTVTRNVVIRDNILDAGNGAATQSILILNEEFNRTGYYDNIKIYDNVIHNALQQGIGIDHVKDLEVYNNTLLWNKAATTQTQPGTDHLTIYPRMIIRDAPDAKVYGNISGASIVNEVLVSGEDNITLSFGNPSSEFYVNKHFVNLSGQGDLNLRDLALMPDSPWKDAYGARLTSDPQHESGEIANGDLPDDIPVIRMTKLAGARDGVEISAALSILDEGTITDSDIVVRWSFDDGHVAEGVSIYHVFDTVGIHSVTMQILEDGTEIASMTRQIQTLPENLIEIDFNKGGIDISGHDSRIDIRDGNDDAFVDEGRDGKAFHLNGGHQLQIDRTNYQFTKLETFELDIGFQKADAAGTGILAMLHKVFTLEIDKNGYLKFSLGTTDGGFSVTATETLSDTLWHDISVHYDGPANKLSLSMDGTVLAENTRASGMTAAGSGFDMVIGSLFSTSVIGLVDQFSLRTPTSSIYDSHSGALPGDDDTTVVVVDTPVEEEEATIEAPLVEDTPVVVEAPVVVAPEPVINKDAPVLEAPQEEVVVVEEDPVTAPTAPVEEVAQPTPPAPAEPATEAPQEPVPTASPEPIVDTPALSAEEVQAEQINSLLNLIERFSKILMGDDANSSGFDLDTFAIDGGLVMANSDDLKNNADDEKEKQEIEVAQTSNEIPYFDDLLSF